MDEYTSRVRIWTLTLPGFPEEIGRARRWTRDVLSDSPHADDAALIITELATNTLIHTSSSTNAFHITLARFDNVLIISVTDHGGTDTAPQVEHPDTNATHGRGLSLVTHLATRIQVNGDKNGRTVTAELRHLTTEVAPCP